MRIRKSFLHCTMLLVLSTNFTTAAEATSLVNLDNVPHNVTLEVAGEEVTVSLMPYQRWSSSQYPIKVKYETYNSPALEVNGEYAIWHNGDIALQRKKKPLNKRY